MHVGKIFMSVINTSFFTSPVSATSAMGKTTASKSAQKATDSSDPIGQFLAYQQLTPQQKLRQAILQKHNLTEETLQNLPADERKKIEEEIKQEIEKLVKNNMAEKGILVDIVA